MDHADSLDIILPYVVKCDIQCGFLNYSTLYQFG